MCVRLPSPLPAVPFVCRAVTHTRSLVRLKAVRRWSVGNWVALRWGSERGRRWGRNINGNGKSNGQWNAQSTRAQSTEHHVQHSQATILGWRLGVWLHIQLLYTEAEAEHSAMAASMSFHLGQPIDHFTHIWAENISHYKFIHNIIVLSSEIYSFLINWLWRFYCV